MPENPPATVGAPGRNPATGDPPFEDSRGDDPDSAFQREIEARVAKAKGPADKRTQVGEIYFEFDWVSGSLDEVCEVYAGVGKLKSEAFGVKVELFPLDPGELAALEKARHTQGKGSRYHA